MLTPPTGASETCCPRRRSLRNTGSKRFVKRLFMQKISRRTFLSGSMTIRAKERIRVRLRWINPSQWMLIRLTSRNQKKGNRSLQRRKRKTSSVIRRETTEMTDVLIRSGTMSTPHSPVPDQRSLLTFRTKGMTSDGRARCQTPRRPEPPMSIVTSTREEDILLRSVRFSRTKSNTMLEINSWTVLQSMFVMRPDTRERNKQETIGTSIRPRYYRRLLNRADIKIIWLRAESSTT